MPVKSRSDWLKRRAEIVAGMQSIMGPFPGAKKSYPLEVRAEAETDCGSYVRRFITYASEPGSRVPAYLLIPKIALPQGKRVPGILALHPTDAEQGHRVVIDSVRDYYAAYARELAERCFVVPAP